VPFSLKTWIDRYAGCRAALPSLDLLVSAAAPDQTLEERLNWLVDVAQWIRRPGHDEQASPASVSLQSGRLRRLLDVLERNPEWKLAVAKTLRSIIRETRAVALFSEAGLPHQSGLLTEISERLTRKFLPPQPGSAELGVLFERLFPYRNDDLWIEKLDEETLDRFGELLEHGVGAEEEGWNRLSDELEDALAYLAAQIRVTGCSRAIRQRLKNQSLRELAFFKLGTALLSTIAAQAKGDEADLLAELNYLRSLIDGCHRARAEVLEHLEKSGVSTEVVYHLAFIEASLQRFQDLLDFAFEPATPMKRSAGFVALLARQNRARESVVDLPRQNCRLLTRKIVERTGETGEHYIARSRQEYGAMLKSAAGGIPEVAEFAGLPLDIRHVTLSACFLTASVASLGLGVLATKAFVLAALGIAGIGFMNLTVSFSLAMFVAIRACDIRSPERHAIYWAVACRAMRNSLSFLIPVNGAREIAAPSPNNI
jgi:site-specific recombinase